MKNKSREMCIRKHLLNHVKRIQKHDSIRYSAENESTGKLDVNTVMYMERLIGLLPLDALLLIQNPTYDIYHDSDGALLMEWALVDGQIVAAIIVESIGYCGYFFDRYDKSFEVETTDDVVGLIQKYELAFSEIEQFSPNYYYTS